MLHPVLPQVMWVLGPHAVPTVADVGYAPRSMQDSSLSLLPQPQHEMCAVFECGRLGRQQNATLERLFASVREIRVALSPMYFFVVLHFSFY